MIQINKVVSALSGLVGWSDEVEQGFADIDLDSSLTASESGLYFQQAHPLITLRNLMSIAPATILDMQKPEKSKAFSSWLSYKTESSIAKAILQYCDNKIVNIMSKPLLENKILFDSTGRITDTIENKGDLVGFEIVPIRSKGVITKINKIGIQFTEPGSYKFYLFKSGQSEAVKEITLEKKTKNTVEWFTPEELLLPYIGDTGEAGGSWYLVYKQSELPEGSKAIKKQYDWSKGPCPACARRELMLYKAWSKYLEIHPFKTEEPDDLALWDVRNNLYTYDTNYGLNLEITIACDLTDFIIEQRAMFKELVWYQVAADLMREMAYNPNARANRFALNASKQEILYELDGDSRSTKNSGLVYKLDKAYKAIDISTRGIDRICLTCKGSGIKFRGAV